MGAVRLARRSEVGAAASGRGGGAHRCFGLRLLGLLHSGFADVQVEPAVLQQTALLLQGSQGRRSELRRQSFLRPPRLTEIVLQSPSRKLRSGVRKLAVAMCRNSRSAPPSLFWYSPTVLRVLPAASGC